MYVCDVPIQIGFPIVFCTLPRRCNLGSVRGSLQHAPSFKFNYGDLLVVVVLVVEDEMSDLLLVLSSPQSSETEENMGLDCSTAMLHIRPALDASIAISLLFHTCLYLDWFSVDPDTCHSVSRVPGPLVQGCLRVSRYP